MTFLAPIFSVLTYQNKAIKVEQVEILQFPLLLFCAIYCWTYARNLEDKNKNKIFWYWATLWWFLLIGRNFNWGRVFFPAIPRIYFHILIFTPLVLSIILPFFFSKQLRQTIW
ncbi:hypothetical protein GKC56_02330 [Neisseriaceae bacterium PsAf]|nr:hypothetical protein [Neisseriaceae bacterium PsAf]